MSKDLLSSLLGQIRSQIRQESLKTFHIVQQGEVGLRTV